MERINIPNSLDDLTDEDRKKLLDELRISRLLLDQQSRGQRLPYIPHFNVDEKSTEYSYWRSTIKGLLKG